MNKIITQAVLAGAYGRKGKPPKGREMLLHSVELDENGSYLRVLCNRVQLDHICDDTSVETKEPTCPECLRALAKLKG